MKFFFRFFLKDATDGEPVISIGRKLKSLIKKKIQKTENCRIFVLILYKYDKKKKNYYIVHYLPRSLKASDCAGPARPCIL